MSLKDKRYTVLNIESLQEEFSDIDPAIVKQEYLAADGDCEIARRTLRFLADVPEAAAQQDEESQRSVIIVQEIEGDLFGCVAEASLCHCVSADLCMGKGIAVAFKQRYGHVDSLKAQGAGVGQAAVLSKPGSNNNNAFVYYLVTKQRYFHKPTLESVRASCEWMRDHALANGVKRIAMPRIACGLDGLQWPVVREMLLQVFSETNGMELQVFTLPLGVVPGGKRRR